MSYDIVKQSFLFTFTEPVPRPGWTTADTYCLFVVFSACSNTETRRYNGSVFCQTTGSKEGIPLWRNRPMLPAELWKWAHAADGGSVKMFPSREITGTAWIKHWKEIGRNPIHLAMDADVAPLGMNISIWVEPDRLRAFKAGIRPAFESYQKHLPLAWDRLFTPLFANPNLSDVGQSIRAQVADLADLAAAVHLLGCTDLEFHINLPERSGERIAFRQSQTA